MFKRALCILLVLALSLACASTALADLTSVTDVEFETRPAYGVRPTEPPPTPTPIPTATPEPTTTPEVTATPVPTATPTASPSPEPTHAPLSNGSRGTEVSALQNALTQLGFSTESADGIYGSRTEAAVSALQSYLMLLNARGQVSYVRLIDGMADSQLLKILLDDGVPAYYATLSDGSSGSQVTRLQKRLTSLDYMLDINVDGAFGPTTESAVKDFQRTNGLSATGIADSQTQNLLFSASAKKCTDPNIRYPYKLIVDVSDQYVYVYKYVNGSYSQYVRKFICSTGTKSDPTPLGTYRSTEQINVWHYFTKFDCWAQYAYRITGAYYFHSVLFNNKGDSNPTSSSVRNLGRRASHGCVRLKVADAKWIYYNCPAGTTVVVRN